MIIEWYIIYFYYLLLVARTTLRLMKTLECLRILVFQTFLLLWPASVNTKRIFQNQQTLLWRQMGWKIAKTMNWCQVLSKECWISTWKWTKWKEKFSPCQKEWNACLNLKHSEKIIDIFRNCIRRDPGLSKLLDKSTESLDESKSILIDTAQTSSNTAIAPQP